MLPPYRHRSPLEEPLSLDNLPGDIDWEGRIAYLDRDGVINRWKENYVNSLGDVEILAGSGKAIASLRRIGFRICVVTNQSPIGRGLWGHEVLEQINDRIQELLLDEDGEAELDLILYSPYAPSEGSWSRKPNPGMLEAGRQLIENAHRFPGEHNVLSYGEEWVDRPSESTSFLIGDRESDILAAERFGVKGILCDPDSGISDVIHRVLDLEER
tara:strand:- start:17529 stop:18170 length:642 start_codon:yes stop_codon:yes gene_type:complete